MSKLIYRTKSPKKGYVNFESFMTHRDCTNTFKQKYPSHEVQSKACKIVSNTMDKLITELKELGYDQTKVSFSIDF